MFAGISSLLKFLKKSFELKNSTDEQEFQTAVINGIGERRKIIAFIMLNEYCFQGDFAEKLPDFQMIEILQYIITSLPMRNEDQKLQLLLLQTIQKVSEIRN